MSFYNSHTNMNKSSSWGKWPQATRLGNAESLIIPLAMPSIDPDLARRIEAIAADRQSGATELSRQAREVLTLALARNCTIDAAAALCRAQPAMAPIWNAAIFAIGDRTSPER